MFKHLKQLLQGSGASGPQMLAAEKLAAEQTIKDDKRYTAEELWLATTMKLSGPRATPPTSRCVRKTVRRLRAGLSIKGSWRAWPAL